MSNSRRRAILKQHSMCDYRRLGQIGRIMVTAQAKLHVRDRRKRTCMVPWPAFVMVQPAVEPHCIFICSASLRASPRSGRSMGDCKPPLLHVPPHCGASESSLPAGAGAYPQDAGAPARAGAVLHSSQTHALSTPVAVPVNRFRRLWPGRLDVSAVAVVDAASCERLNSLDCLAVRC
jgi:hypothetical protein